MASCDAELAGLSGSELVKRLRTTWCLADYEATARIIDARDARLAELEAALAEAKEGHAACEARIASMGGALAESREELRARDRELAEAKAGLNTRDAWIASVRAALAESKERLRARDRELAEAKEDLLARGRKLAKAMDGLDARDRELAEAKAGLNTRDAWIASVRAALAESRERLKARDRELAEAKGDLVARDRRLAKAKEGLDARDARIASVEGALAESKENLRALDARLATAEAALAEAKESLKARDRELAEAKEELKARDARLATAEAALAETKKALVARDARLAEGLELHKLGLSLSDDVAMARAEQGTLLEGLTAMREKIEALAAASRKPLTEDTLGNPRSECARGRSRGEDARRGTRDVAVHPGKTIAAPAPAPCIEVTEEKKATFINLCGSDEEEEQEGSRRDVSGVSRKRNAATSSCLSDGDDDTLTLSQLMKKKQRAGTLPEDVEEPKSTDSVRRLEDYPLEESPAIKEEIIQTTVGGSNDPMVATLVQERGNVKLEENEGMSRTMPSAQPLGSAEVNSAGPFGIDKLGISLPPPPGFPARTGSQKNFSKPNHSGPRIIGKEANTLKHGISLAPPPGFPARTKDGGQVMTSDKQLGSSTLLPKNVPHSEQTSVEGSLPAAVTRNWKYATDLFVSFYENKEICMQAACALYRQKRSMFQQTEGEQSGSSGLRKSDANRVAKLVEFLLDGNIEGPLKRTVEEFAKFDYLGHGFLLRIVPQFSDELFEIYKNREDPYFR